MKKEISKVKLKEVEEEILKRKQVNEGQISELNRSAKEMKIVIYSIGGSVFLTFVVGIYMLIKVLTK
jgi:hypothetical protein